MNLMSGDDPMYLPDLPIVFSWSLSLPGVPFTSILNSVILLFNTYNIRHSSALDSEADMQITTGNPETDERFMADYLNFKMFLDGLNREYEDIQCDLQGTGIGLYMTFKCR
ncbi:hypothetical protein AH04_58 [Erwinia phage AH04]|uniref:Uncharacterized protein n=1 Tax=Erwinia phage AH04 TaxID=2869569 RepID=A0AAE7X0P4_9CAUD|nr:hypothetical protein PQC02_gp256 [Erwinia phage AH04]QZA70541.1 hypothetical protein AH04_58 [Erwinia phage AH04]